MKKPYKRCNVCKIKKSDVKKRKCGFTLEIHNSIKMEQICNDCEHEHLLDI